MTDAEITALVDRLQKSAAARRHGPSYLIPECERLEAAAAALLAQQERIRELTEWQPIETAPRSHSPVLVWSVKYGRIVAFLDVTWAWWPCPANNGPLYIPPTHWRPLPPAPKDTP